MEVSGHDQPYHLVDGLVLAQGPNYALARARLVCPPLLSLGAPHASSRTIEEHRLPVDQSV